MGVLARRLAEECDKRGLPRSFDTLMRHIENNHAAALDASRYSNDLLRQRLEGAVEERDKLRRLVLRDHAQGHKAHADCPACWKFGVRPNGWKGGR